VLIVVGVVGLILLAGGSVGVYLNKRNAERSTSSDRGVGSGGNIDGGKSGDGEKGISGDRSAAGDRGAGGDRGTAGVQVKRSSPPQGWKDYTAPDGSFRIFLPADPDIVRNYNSLRFVPGSSKALTIDVTGKPGQPFSFAMAVATVGGDFPKQEIEDSISRLLLQIKTPLSFRVTKGPVTWSGRPAIEETVGPDDGAMAIMSGRSTTQVFRATLDGNRFYMFWVTVGGDREFNARCTEFGTFFESFEILK
jgi:hypothetical protein